MLFKLSVKNVGKSLKDYAVYFVTLTAGVAIFYVFNAVETQAAVLSIMQRGGEILSVFSGMLNGVSVLVSLILGFLVIYAGRFLMKRRKREFGLYLLLGLGKWKVSMILFWETLLIGVCSLAAGLLFGVAASQFMSLFVANLFSEDMTAFRFLFSKTAFEKTVLHFAVIYLIVILFQVFEIGKCRLITFFQAKERSEQVKMRNPWVCTAVFLAAAGMLGYAYYQVTGNVENLHSSKGILRLILLGIAATFLLFWSVSGLAVKLFGMWEKQYYKGLHAFIFRQLAGRINTAVCIMSIICLMLFVTICVLSASLSVKNSMDRLRDELAPVDIIIRKRIALDDGETEVISTSAVGLGSRSFSEYTEEQLEGLPLSVKEVYGQMGIDLSRYFKEEADFSVYRLPELTIGDLFERTGEKRKEFDMGYYLERPVRIVAVSDYNRLLALFGREEMELGQDEYSVVANLPDMVLAWNAFLAADVELTLSDIVLHPEGNACRNGFLNMAADYEEHGFLVAPDEAVTQLTAMYEYVAANYNGNTEEEKWEVEKTVTLQDVYEYPESYYTWVSANTRLDVTDAGVGIGGILTFLGLYLGIVFLLASAVILALKELSESADNAGRYRLLRQLGTDENMINGALFRQIGLFFMMPLALALLHAVFGIRFGLYMLRSFGRTGLLSAILETVAVFLVIYGGYFALTYVCSKNIIRDKA
ncbi:MAG: FtsX-like permease family protein [Clostridium sp.]|nr:FtsX-like permease family protein [Clostridium sp.]